MHRKEFIEKCGFACLGLMGFATLAASCSTTKQLSGNIDSSNKLAVPLASFANKEAGYKRYIIIRNDKLNYPIVVYRHSDKEYTALLLRCTHQQNELNVAGELLTCPAHGSEFDTRGKAIQGPAEAALRQFPTTMDEQNLYLQLS